MANATMRKILLAAGLLCLPLMHLSAINFSWGSDDGTGAGHSATFLATAAGLSHGNVNVDGTGGRFIFSNSGETLTLDGTITVSGDVIIDATQFDGNIQVGGPLMSVLGSNALARGYVHVRPQAAAATDWGHLAFLTAADRRIEVMCDNYTLAFTGSHNPTLPLDQDLVVSVWGQGQVKFRIKDGLAVVFRNVQEVNDATGLINPAGISTYSGGTIPTTLQGTVNPFSQPQPIPTVGYPAGVRVFIVMDQSQPQNSSGDTQLVFSRFQYAEETVLQNPKAGQPADVWIGNNSFITFASDNATGVVTNIGNTTFGFGALEFDSSAQGTSRLTLRLFGAQRDPFNDEYNSLIYDAALVVCGHYIPTPSTMPGVNTEPNKAFAAVRFAELNQMAGVEACFKVNDTNAFVAQQNYYGLPNSRRGLVVVNGCNHVPAFASNPYSIDRENPNDPGRVGNEFFWRGSSFNLATLPTLTPQKPRIREGFVIGVNGHMKIQHNCFLHYVATSQPMIPDYVTNQDFSHVKSHNPAALIIDGLTLGEDVNGNPYPHPLNGMRDAVAFTAFRDGGRHAKISLVGNGSLYLQSAAPILPQQQLNFSSVNMHSLRKDKDRLGMTRAIDNFGLYLDYGIFTGGRPEGYLYFGADVFPYGSQNLLTENMDWVYSFSIGAGPYSIGTDLDCPVFSVPALDCFVNVPQDISFSPETKNADKIKARKALQRTRALRVLQTRTITSECTLEDAATHRFGEGDHVLDVEGRLTCCSIDDIDLPGAPTRFGQHVSTNTSRDGKLNVAPLVLDHVANEIALNPITGMRIAASRPLDGTGETYYPRAQSAGMFFNSPVDYPFFGAPSATFSDVNIIHNDVNKNFILPDPMRAEPAITGGSRAIWDDALFSNAPFTLPAVAELPVIRLVNSKIHLYESLVSSGVRYEITEQAEDLDGFALFGSSAANTSSIISYNHGDLLDTRDGYGRMFMLGTLLNGIGQNVNLSPDLKLINNEAVAPYISRSGSSFADFTRTQYPLETAFVNIYRRTQTPSDETSTDTIQLSLNTAPQFPTDLSINQQAKQNANHLIFMSGDSNVTMGWTGEFGDVIFHPWWNTLAGSQTEDQFTIAGVDEQSNTIQPAALLLDANYYWFGGVNTRNGLVGVSTTLYPQMVNPLENPVNSAIPFGQRGLSPVIDAYQGNTVYVNNGGKLKASPDIDSIFDTIIARRLSTNDALSGQIDVPMDQIRFTKMNSIQPYALDLTNGSLHLDTFNNGRIGGLAVDATSAEEMTISWRYRDDSSNFLAIKSPTLKGLHKEHARKHPSHKRVNVKEEMLRSARVEQETTRSITSNASYRSTVDLNGPVTKPSNVLFVTTGDLIRQLRVSGATIADPFTLEISGDGSGFARIREFTTQPLTRTCALALPTYGDGDYATLILNGSGRIGLGQADWNEHSLSAWSRLGWDYVTIVADGNGVVDVNSDLLIADKLPIIPTTNFGNSVEQRVEFFSDDYRVIRVPAGYELDLSSFGRGQKLFALQQIAFGGKVKLVFEPGSTLRFPDGAVVDSEAGNGTGVILYMNDESELVFAENRDRDRAPFEDATGFENLRCKILGKGQIWLNKQAKLKILGESALAIQADAKTPHTDVTISIQRQGEMQVGNTDTAGGQFQVGNTFDIQGSSINFTLRLSGPKARFLLEREGFFGLGVGIVNKLASNPNGDTDPALNPIRDNLGLISSDPETGLPRFSPNEETAWRVQTLYNVNNVEVRLIQGVFDHSNIYDGNSDLGSVMAVGPLAGTYTFNIGQPRDAVVRGGGNLMFFRSVTSPFPINIWSAAEALVGNNDDNGKYTLLSSTEMLRQKSIGTTAQAATNSSIIDNGLGASITGGITIEGVVIPKSVSFVGGFDDMYKFLAFPNYRDMKPNKFVTMGATTFENKVGYVNDGVRTANVARASRLANATNIVREVQPLVLNADGQVGNIEDAIKDGTLGGSGFTGPNRDPERRSVVRRA